MPVFELPGALAFWPAALEDVSVAGRAGGPRGSAPVLLSSSHAALLCHEDQHATEPSPCPTSCLLLPYKAPARLGCKEDCEAM